MRKFILLAIVLLALLIAVGMASAQGRPFSTSLSGAEEVDPVTGALGAGDPDASGDARITLNEGQGEIRIEATVHIPRRSSWPTSIRLQPARTAVSSCTLHRSSPAIASAGASIPIFFSG